jgi:UDP-N-acetylmuramoyl-tripeptide--D-alanyl-D-alanine ligase
MTWPRLKDFLHQHRFKLLIGLGSALLALGTLSWWLWGEPHFVRMALESPASGRCDRELSKQELNRSLDLAGRFLMAHQKPAGNFNYEYDYSTKAFSPDDNDVRQAGALWGISLLLQDRHSPELQQAVERGLAFFEEHSRRTKGGRRCVTYPGVDQGGTGTIALVALAHIEYLRSLPAGQDDAQQGYRLRLREYLKQLEAGLRDDGVWYGDYDSKNCRVGGEPSPYADGEALLALVKAAKYLGYKELEPTILRAAAAGRKRNIDDALAAHPDSDTTKGYYQWSSMAFYEMVTSDMPGVQSYGDTLLRLADWMIDEHDTLWRFRNTGYAYEGIIHAYAYAKQRGDEARVKKYGCVIDVGLSRLLSWQVGGPLASSFANRGKDDRLALGGVQNEARAAPLRIDVTQHQSHAVLLALRYAYQ